MALDPKRWTHRTQEAVQASVELTKTKANPEITTWHLLSALIGQADGVVLPVLQKVGVAPMSLRNKIEDELDKLPQAYGGEEPKMTRELGRIFDRADGERKDLTDEYLSTEHLLLAMNQQVGVPTETLRNAIVEVRGSHRVTSQNPEDTLSLIHI